MRNRKTKSQKIRDMIEAGHTTKDIVTKFKCKPQTVYSIRYLLNKSKGIATLGGKAAPAAQQQGIASLQRTTITSPRPRGRPRKNPEPIALPIQMIEPPSLWQRVKGWFRGANA